MINRAVFTHWSDATYLNRYCGFNTKKDFFHSFALALFCARSFFSKVILYTDNQGKKDVEPFHQLIDEVHTDIEILNEQDIPRSLWAYPKIITYSLQEQPFLHIDNDVFFWERPKIEFLHQELVCQSIEYKMEMYDFCFKKILNSPLRGHFIKHQYLLRKLLWACGLKGNKTNPILTPNFGVFGGKDVAFINDYANIVLNILKNKKNLNYLKKFDLGDSFNAIFEQWIFSQLAFKENKKIIPLLNPPAGYRICNEFSNKNAVVYKAPQQIKYTHLVAGSKRDPLISKKVENKVSKIFPKHIVDILNNKI